MRYIVTSPAGGVQCRDTEVDVTLSMITSPVRGGLSDGTPKNAFDRTASVYRSVLRFLPMMKTRYVLLIRVKNRSATSLLMMDIRICNFQKRWRDEGAEGQPYQKIYSRAHTRLLAVLFQGWTYLLNSSPLMVMPSVTGAITSSLTSSGAYVPLSY